MTELLSRDEAKEQGKKRFFTGVPCSYGHIAERYVSTYKCIGCDQRYNAAISRKKLEEKEREEREKMLGRFIHQTQPKSAEDRALWKPINSSQRVYKELFAAMGWA